jgi:hypothetical protein
MKWHDARKERPKGDRYILVYGKDISFTMATGYLTYCDLVSKDLNPIVEIDPNDCPAYAVSFPKAVEYWCYIDEIPLPKDS